MEKYAEVRRDSVKKQYFYPNRMGRIILSAMGEILGQDGVNAVLRMSGLPDNINDYPPLNQDLKFPFSHLSLLQAGLEREYGLQAGRGLAYRIGRACLKYGLREFGLELGLNNLAYRLLPLQAKIKTGSKALAALFNDRTDLRVTLEMDEKYILWNIQRCPLCWERHADGPCCHLAVGLLQEALFWVSGGRFFVVEETKCIAYGDSACTMRIDQIPIG